MRVVAVGLPLLLLAGCWCCVPNAHPHSHPHHTHPVPRPAAPSPPPPPSGALKRNFRCPECRATAETALPCHGKPMLPVE